MTDCPGKAVHNPYQPPNLDTIPVNTESAPRVFKVHILAKLLVVALELVTPVVLFVLVHLSGLRIFFELFPVVIFVFCLLSYVFLLAFNKYLMENFYLEHPVIHDQSTLDKLKPVLRINNYSALCFLFLLWPLGVVSGLVILVQSDMHNTGFALALFLVAIGLTAAISSTERKIKHIPCSEHLEVEVFETLKRWQFNMLQRP